MVSVDEITDFYGITDITKKILNLNASMFGMNKILLFFILSGALVMVFQGKNYKNVCMSIVIGVSMISVDPDIHRRLLGLNYTEKGVVAAILRSLSKVFVSEIMFCLLCLLMGYVVNMCMLPIFWAAAFVFGISIAKETFTESLKGLHAQDMFVNIGILFMFVVAIRNFEKAKLAIYSLFFSVFGSTVTWMALEAILDEDLGFGTLGLDLFEIEDGNVFKMPQLYPFLILVAIGMVSQIKFNNILSIYRRQNVVSIMIRRSTNKIIEI